jgi:hypothetical protein
MEKRPAKPKISKPNNREKKAIDQKRPKKDLPQNGVSPKIGQN